jgi:hypothetical protein
LGVLRPVAFVAALQLAGCADRACTLETVVDEFLVDSNLVQCGSLDVSASNDAPLGEAHDCVLAAQAQRQAFVVFWYIQGIEGVDRSAYAAVHRDGTYQLAAFHQGYNVDTTVLPTVVRTCTHLNDKGACALPTFDLCLQCELVEQQSCEP